MCSTAERNCSEINCGQHIVKGVLIHKTMITIPQRLHHSLYPVLLLNRFNITELSTRVIPSTE